MLRMITTMVGRRARASITATSLSTVNTSSPRRNVIVWTTERFHGATAAAAATPVTPNNTQGSPSEEPSKSSSNTPEWLRQSIQRLLERQDHRTRSEVATVKPEEIQRTLRILQSHISEARSCIQDCSLPDVIVAEEVISANRALEKAVATFVDFLDVVRAAQTQDFQEHRQRFVEELRELREQLHSVEVSSAAAVAAPPNTKVGK